ncbi:tyrosine-type recombinase/integrase [Campylobacter hyointestinalis]|uniref:tyrosine-type recombinase/integrase n=1 Tax=Campylobacter hyointestinalis TaxID=198 RepID=UPI000727AA38|nr:site-specific integrase [Campylobacter hyointestinalis]CUU70845.1 phage integrase family site specific recombinase [Campylobacter hyointestinalis subsp. hyointestinalis]CUU70859.1 phage integrase family site specific recombinase [Campylobacter hyointestinalis subsp. hyointestinalis]
MSRVATKILFSKDIKNLKPKSKLYKRVVGNPKELYIFIYPSGKKTFNLKINSKFRRLNEFREKIYGLVQARNDAFIIIRELESNKFKNIQIINKKNDKYLFKNLTNQYLDSCYKKGLKSTDKKAKFIQNHLLPTLGMVDAKDIKYSDLLCLFKSIYISEKKEYSRVALVQKLICYTKAILDYALKDEYISKNPATYLKNELPTPKEHNKKYKRDGRVKAITDLKLLKAFIRDFKLDTNHNMQIKRAMWLQILTCNRPFNIVSAKWKDIDLVAKRWVIPADEMKTGIMHEVALSDYALEILKQQLKLKDINGYVFPSLKSLHGHLSRDILNQYIHKLGYNASPHGFRATFRTICSINEIELLKLGIGNKTIESCLAHKTTSEVQYIYERKKTTFEKKLILMQWYSSYLNNIENLDIL